ncbi:MAG: MFS transporter [Desulfobulbaceae bacterium]
MSSSPFSVPNIRLFILLRVCFNARFYYPVFTILFLDFGLTLEQFAILNAAWAGTIVLAEVPSGALADILGRKRLLQWTALLMILEMSVLSFVPLGDPGLVFWAFFCNRVLSGLAEAMASGADEALAYDSLVLRGLAEEWPRVLDIQMRIRSIGFVVSMTVGALVYDPDTVNQVLGWLNTAGSVTQKESMRYPVYLTLLLAVLAFVTTLFMKEARVDSGTVPHPRSFGGKVADSLRLVRQAGAWIAATPFAMAVILYAMTFDHSLRMIVTMTSQYFRLIGLPEAVFGLIGSGIGLLGLVVPRIARAMVRRFTPAWNLGILSLIAFSGLLGLTGFFPYLGVVPMVLVFVGLMLTTFFSSHYLNQVTASSHRATVLSFKGLGCNLAYGVIGMLYAGLIEHLREGLNFEYPSWTREALENETFRRSIDWFPWYTMVAAAVVTLVFLRFYRQNRMAFVAGGEGKVKPQEQVSRRG